MTFKLVHRVFLFGSLLLVPGGAIPKEFSTDTPLSTRIKVHALYKEVSWNHGVFQQPVSTQMLTLLLESLKDQDMRGHAEYLIYEALAYYSVGRDGSKMASDALDKLGYSPDKSLCVLAKVRSIDGASEQLEVLRKYRESRSGREQIQFVVDRAVEVGTEEAANFLLETKSQIQPHLDEYRARIDFGLRSIKVRQHVVALPDDERRFAYLKKLIIKEKPPPKPGRTTSGLPGYGWGRLDHLEFLLRQISEIDLPATKVFLEKEMRSDRNERIYCEQIEKILLRKGWLTEPIFLYTI